MLNAILVDRVDVGSSTLTNAQGSNVDIEYASLPDLPLFSLIGRTTVIVDCSSPHEIVTRITRCLQMLSIIATFDSKAMAFVAEAIDHTKFSIRFYKTKNRCIWVEFQRLDGYSFNFIDYARMLRSAVRGTVIEGSTVVKRSSLCYIPASPASMCHLPEDEYAKYMLHIEELLKSNRSDAVRLGIESLLLLTDRHRSQLSLYAAEAVLGNRNPVIKDFIHYCISSLSDKENDFDCYSYQSEVMRNIALAVLGNSLQTASDSGSSILSNLVQSDEWMERRSGLVDVLIYYLTKSPTRCHDAYHSSRCLNALLGSSSEMKRALVERELSGIMKQSQSVGHERHSLLAQECDAALALMSSSEMKRTLVERGLPHTMKESHALGHESHCTCCEAASELMSDVDCSCKW